MAENQNKIDELISRLEILIKKQDVFYQEIYNLREEINSFKAAQIVAVKDENIAPSNETRPEQVKAVNTETVETIYQKHQAEILRQKRETVKSEPIRLPKIRSDIEKFIGENLINKIGIVITVIGVAIGAKYSIDHQLISPLTRIILGYLAGGGLIAFGIKLKRNYDNYSAVLVSGAIAILYFITYAAYSFYGLFPQVLAFVLMVVFTAFTVVAAIKYNKQVIAHIGLVGAYAVPFLLSDGSGKVAVLFSYMAIINIGILTIAFKKYWKPLYYVSFSLTWLIFFSWYSLQYQHTLHFTIALIFIAVFFATFYTMFLAYKLIRRQMFEKGDIILLLVNSFLFYGIGYSILEPHETGKQLLGLFTLFNALIHFSVTAIIYKQKLADKNLFYLLAGLVLVFITIAIPVQLNGNWVTLLWAFEALLLFWIGRSKNIPLYEKLAQPLIFLAFFSMVHDWLTLYNNYNTEQPNTKLTPVLNVNFLSSLLFSGAFVFINYLNNNPKNTSVPVLKKPYNAIMQFSIPAILIIGLYYTFRLEITTYWNQLFSDSYIQINKKGQDYGESYFNYDLRKFRNIWVINYTLLFLSILSFLNIYRFKNKNLASINLILNTIAIIVFLTSGLYSLSELRDSYLNQTLSEFFPVNEFNIGIRYVSYFFVALLLTACYKYIQQSLLHPVPFKLTIAFHFLLYLSLLWIASSELVGWLDMMHFSQSDKLGLSILWGSYALLLIIIGIWKNKKHLRIGAIILFGVTLIKLFFYDISHLDTIAKTIVFVSLGVLLLIISFLYNKYRLIISREHEN